MPINPKETSPRRSPTTTLAIKLNPNEAYTYQNRGDAKQALGDLDGALADINQAIRLNPALPSPLIHRVVIWRAKGDLDRAIADGTAAVRLASNPPPNIMTPPGSIIISAHLNRGLAYESKGDYEHARADFAATLDIPASDAGSTANQETAKIRLSLLSDTNVAPSPPSPSDQQTAPAPAPAVPAGRRAALVIGNGAYTGVKALPNPPNDARAIAKSLRDIGFVVSEGIDLDRAAMQKMTRDFLRERRVGRSRWSITRATACKSTAATT
jgi:tetratricopeptide (TPR) repeat protein